MKKPRSKMPVRERPIKADSPPPTTDSEFMRWAAAWKRCKRCQKDFVGPVCECER